MCFYFYIESSLASSDRAIVNSRERTLSLSIYMYILLVGLLGHALRAYARSADTLQEQLRDFQGGACQSRLLRPRPRRQVSRGREIILECIAAWYSSPDSFELQVQTEVRMAIIDQLSYKTFSYPPTLQAFTPNVWLRLGYAASNADNPIRQVVDLAQTSW